MPQILIELINGGFVVTADSPDQRIDHGHGLFEQRPQPPQRFIGRNLADLQEIVVPAVLNLTRPLEPVIAGPEPGPETNACEATPQVERAQAVNHAGEQLRADRRRTDDPKPETSLSRLEKAAEAFGKARYERDRLTKNLDNTAHQLAAAEANLQEAEHYLHLAALPMHL